MKIVLCILILFKAFCYSLFENQVNVLTGEHCEETSDLKFPGPYSANLKRFYGTKERSLKKIAPEWQFNFPDLFESDKPRTKIPTEFNCEVKALHDDQMRIKQLQFFSQGTREIVDTWTIEHGTSSCTITSSTGNSVCYCFKQESNHTVLEKVEKNGRFDSSYSYIPHPKERKFLLSSKQSANGESLTLEYYLTEENFQFGKVKKLTYFKNQAVCFSCQFTYKEHETEIVYSSGVKKKFIFNDAGEILKIEESENGVIFKTEEFSWHLDQLESKTIFDSLHEAKQRSFYTYDSQNNLSKETLCGDLTGSGEEETYSKTYVYSEEGALLEEHEDNGISHRYIYNEKNMPSAVFILDHGAVVQRSFFSFDENNCLIEEIKDNGTSFDKKNLSSVTYRSEMHYGPFHALGMPLCITEKNTQMKTSKQWSFHYSPEGKLLEKRLTNEDGSLLSFQKWSYDKSGKHSHTIEQESEIYCSYDLNDRLVVEWDSKDSYETRYCYKDDVLYKVEKVFFDGKQESSTYFYDERGNLSASLDYLGNETQFIYDKRNRKIAILQPQNEKAHASTHFSYDIFDQTIQVTDAKGYITTTSYNCRGQTTAIYFPDGTRETFRYFLDGKLKEETKRDRKTFRYEYDALGNIIKKETFFADGTLCEAITYDFSNPHTITEESTKNGLKRISLNNFGKIAQIESCKEQHLVQLTYDQKGQLVEKQDIWQKAPEFSRHEFINEHSIAIYNFSGECCYEQMREEEPEEDIEKTIIANPQGQYVLELKSYDKEGNTLIIQYNANEKPTLEIKKDPFGREIYSKQLIYDVLGNKIRDVYRVNGQDVCVTAWVYGPMNRLEETIEAYGTPFQKSHRYSYGHFGELLSITKPDGVHLSYEYDSAGNVKRQFSSDSTIDYSFEYDNAGNLILAKDNILNNVTLRIYNENNQLVQETLPSGLGIANSYDAIGRRNKLFLHDNSSITYTYDALYLREITRENGSIAYSHGFTSYDLQGHLLVSSFICNLGNQYCSSDGLNLHSPYHICKNEENQRILMHPFGVENITLKRDSLEQIQLEEGSFNEAYIYDRLGNHNVSFELQYDLNGNLISKKRDNYCYQYSYDALNRLSEVSLNGMFLAKYFYDCFHRRIAKKTAFETFYFVYDGLTEIGKTAEDGTFLEFRVVGSAEDGQSGKTVAIELKGVPYAPLHDLQGSIIGLVSSEKKCIEELYCHSAFGKEKKLYGETIQNPWRYADKRIDDETGLIFFGRRYYDPELRRWITPDPSGYADGPNLYLFAKNDPLKNKDAFGLFSFKSFLNILLHPLELIDRLIGKAFNYLCGYYLKDCESGVYGKGEVSDKVRVTMINGMLTNKYWLLIAAKALSESHGGVNIHYVHRPPSNLLLDFCRSHMVKKGCISPHARLLAETWKKLIQEMGGAEAGGLIIHYAHSIGTCETMAALSLMTKKEQNMIKVYSFGSPFLSNKQNYQIQFFVSVRDGVCLLDLPNIIKAAKGKNPYVTFVGSFLGIPFIDHLFGTKSYVDIWSAMGKTFVEWYGSLI